MTSKRPASETYVWLWLPGATEPVVAGLLRESGDELVFNYGKSYLARNNAVALSDTELPLKAGIQQPQNGLMMPSCLRDAAPDAWGRRVILNRLANQWGADVDTASLSEMTYLLESGSDRPGNLDFQASPSDYRPRLAGDASLEELLNAAAMVERGLALTPDLADALYHGTALGGARPKASISGDKTKCIAKFSASTDLYPVVKAEFVAMRLAQLAGLNVADVQLECVAERDVLLVTRFDRERSNTGWTRKAMVSALTLLQLDDMTARYASYEDLSHLIRARFSESKSTLRELFSRLVFNILCGNTDDHARNHAAFWDGFSLSLTPAYDICPQGRVGNEASQAMKIVGERNLSQLAVARAAAPNFLLSDAEALAIFDHFEACIDQHWNEVCEAADLSPVHRKLWWERQFLNPWSRLRTE